MEFTTRIGFGSGRMELLPRLTIPGRFLIELLQCVLARRTVSIAMVECLSWMSVCSRERALNSEVGSDIHSLQCLMMVMVIPTTSETTLDR